MLVRNITTRSLAVAAVLALVTAPLAAQQDTTRLRRTSSQTRINVSKGEVELRVDTVYMTRYDTVRVENTIVRVDTVTVATPAPIITREVGAFYWGLLAGATVPASDIDRLYTNGFHGGGVVGWEPRNAWYGFRMEASLNQIGREQGRLPLLVGTGTPLLWNVAADLKLKAPLGGWSFYGIGGLGFNSYKRIATAADLDEADLTINPLIDDGTTTVDNADDITACGVEFDGEGNCFRLANNDDWRTRFSWNFGAGLDFHIGSQDMFVETRAVAISAHGAYTWYVPVSLGVRYLF